MIVRGIRNWKDINMAELDLSKLITHFARSNQADGKSRKTVSWYSEMLLDFARYLGQSDRHTTLGELHAENVREYIVHEQERNMSPHTVQAKVRALKAFSSWLLREEYAQDNLLKNIRLPKVPVKVIDTLTEDEIKAIINTQNPLTSPGSRNVALLVILLDTGLRCSELSNLLLEDAHVEEGYLKVMGKGSKERIVPIGAMTRKYLWRYMLHFRPKPVNVNNDYLFLTLSGEKLEYDAIRQLLKRLGRKAGIPRLHAHLCRHTYATNYLYHECGNVFMLQQILGHSTLEMVRRYIHNSSYQSLINGKSPSPMDQMNMRKPRINRIEQIMSKTNPSHKEDRYG